MRRALATLTAVLVAAVVVSGPAVAGGSDSVTPYTVTAAGIEFPTPLTAHGHVNIRLTDGTARGLHFDPNNGHPGAAWIGATFLPWTALGVTSGCIAWGQWSDTNEHYGEGGQAPVCIDTPTTPPATPEPTEEPTWTAEPEPSVAPSQSTPSEQPSQPSEPSPTLSETPVESTPSVEPTSVPEPQPSTSSTSPTSTPTPSSDVPLDCPDGTVPGWEGEDGQPTSCVDDRPTSWPGDEPETPGDVDHPECELGLEGECDAGDPCSVTPSACPTVEPTTEPAVASPVDPTDPAATPPVVPDTLPQTGAHTLAATTLAVALAVAGVALLTARRRTS